MKNIIFVVGNYKNGGVPMHATNLANEFGKKGYSVIILVTKEIAKEVYFSLHEKVKVISLKEFFKENEHNEDLLDEINKQNKKIKLYKRIRYISKYIKKWDEILDRKIRTARKSGNISLFLKKYTGAIVIPFGLEYYEMAYYAVKERNCKIIYAERNAPELEVPKDKKRANELLRILKYADGGVFQTEDEKSFYNQFLNKNISIIHNPIKEDLPKSYVGIRRKIIVNFCRIAEQKNLRLLVDSFVMLNKVYPEYELHIYGNTVEKSEELLRDELKEYVKIIGMDGIIKILPPVADVHKRIVDCAMFVSSSDFEGLSNSMIEAMAIGLPCICTDCLGGGAREMIEHNVNGLLVPMKDKEALYSAMKYFIENPDNAEIYGKEASKIIEEMSAEKIAEKWINVIENV